MGLLWLTTGLIWAVLSRVLRSWTVKLREIRSIPRRPLEAYFETPIDLAEYKRSQCIHHHKRLT